MADDGYSDVVQFLSDSRSYGCTAPVERVETHCAYVFLAGEHAYKIKKPVRFSYLDFSTRVRRHAALLRELELNRRGAPGLYLEVLPVTRGRDGALALGGAGKPLEWVLHMRRFAQEDRLDVLAVRCGLNDALVDTLALAISAFHAAAPVVSDPAFGGAAAMGRLLGSNLHEIEAAVGPIFATDAAAALDEALHAHLQSFASLLDARRANGFVRRCHGDLHLGNMALLDGAPVLFDCIEFSEDIGTIDILYDLAFLLMDLAHRGYRHAASRVFNRYLEAAPLSEMAATLSGLALMPFFLANRALVRAHVEARIAMEGDGNSATARHYLTEAHRHLAPHPPRLMVVGGVSGTGKSTLARALAPEFGRAYGALILRSDVTRKRRAGLPPDARLPPDAYSADESRHVYDTLLDWAGRALRAGETVILDAVFLRPEERSAAEAVAAEAGVRFTGLWLEGPADLLRARVATRQGDVSDATPVVLDRQLALETGPIRWARLDAGQGTAEILGAVRRQLGAGPDFK